HAESDATRLVDAARAAWAEVAGLRTNGIDADELDRVRRILEARALRRLETMEGQASWLAEWELLGGWERGERYREALLATTPEEVTAAARRWLAPEAAGAIVYRPRGSDPVAADAGAFFGVIGGGQAHAVQPAAPPVAPAALTHAPALERVEAGVHVFRTDAGVPVLVVPKPGLRIVHLAASALGGAVTEPDGEEGLAALAAAASVKGTVSRTAAAIAEEAERLGGSVGASAGSESAGWGISVPTEHFAPAAALLADVVQRATFPDAAVDTERGVLVQEARTLRDDMYRWPMRLATEAAFAGHPYGRPVGGTETSLAGLTAERVRAWHASTVAGGAWALAVVGDVDPAQAAAVVAGAFGALRLAEPPAIPVPAWPREVVVRAEPRDKRQTALAILFPGAARRDPARITAGLLAGIASGLGGRFFDELRDRRSLAYTVHAFGAPRRLAGTFGAYIATGPGQEAEAREGLLAEFAKLAADGVTADELSRAQTYALGTYAIARQGGGAVLGDVLDAWQAGDGLRELDEYEARVRAVTPNDVRAFAAAHFDPARRAEGVVRGVDGGEGGSRAGGATP
ncbi:MAG TPA: insulinase family protein, partial [Gemmatirosa sp.]